MAILVATFYAVWAILIVAFQMKQIRKNGEIRLINFANLMYAFTYGLIPAIVFPSAEFGNPVIGIDTSSKGAVKLLIVLLISVFVHFIYM